MYSEFVVGMSLTLIGENIMKNFFDNQIQRGDVDYIRQQLNEAIATKLEELGMEGGFTNAKYSADSIDFKVVIKRVGTLSHAEQTKRNDLSCRIMYGEEFERWGNPTPDQIDDFLDKIHTVGRHRVRLTGYNSRSKRYPIEYVEVDGDRRMKGGDHYLTIAADKFFGKQGKAA
jgi:hypothetical protein